MDDDDLTPEALQLALQEQLKQGATRSGLSRSGLLRSGISPIAEQGEGEGGEGCEQTRYEPSEGLQALSSRFIGAAIEVHRHLGAGYTEPIYARALRRELGLRGIPFRSETPLEIVYKQSIVGQFRFDLIIDEQLLVELKAVESITSVHIAQVIAYLKAGGFRVGLIVNFNVPRLQQGLRRVTWPK
jgi:GxxExxY protein